MRKMGVVQAGQSHGTISMYPRRTNNFDATFMCGIDAEFELTIRGKVSAERPQSSRPLIIQPHRSGLAWWPAGDAMAGIVRIDTALVLDQSDHWPQELPAIGQTPKRL